MTHQTSTVEIVTKPTAEHFTHPTHHRRHHYTIITSNEYEEEKFTEIKEDQRSKSNLYHEKVEDSSLETLTHQTSTIEIVTESTAEHSTQPTHRHRHHHTIPSQEDKEETATEIKEDQQSIENEISEDKIKNEEEIDNTNNQSSFESPAVSKKCDDGLRLDDDGNCVGK
jgi:hypothetical protein